MTEGGIVSSNICLMYSTPPPECQHVIRNACTFKVCLDCFFFFFFFLNCTTVGNVIVCFCFTQAAVKKPQGLPSSFRRTKKKKKKNLIAEDIILCSSLGAPSAFNPEHIREAV